MFKFLFRGKTKNEKATSSITVALSDAISEAISSLGLVSSEIHAPLQEAMLSMQDHGSKAISLHLRKQKPQIDERTRDTLGLSKRTYFSMHLAKSLTMEGHQDPMSAIDATVIRAMGSFARAQRLMEGKSKGHIWVQVRSYQSGGCSHCESFEGQFLPIESVTPLPPAECQKVNCRYFIQTLSDFSKKCKEKKQ